MRGHSRPCSCHPGPGALPLGVELSPRGHFSSSQSAGSGALEPGGDTEQTSQSPLQLMGRGPRLGSATLVLMAFAGPIFDPWPFVTCGD